MKVTHLTLLFMTFLLCPVMGEILSQSFVIKLNEMAQIIEDQKSVIKDQENMLVNLTQVVEDQQEAIASLKNESSTYNYLNLLYWATQKCHQIPGYDKVFRGHRLKICNILLYSRTILLEWRGCTSVL